MMVLKVNKRKKDHPAKDGSENDTSSTDKRAEKRKKVRAGKQKLNKVNKRGRGRKKTSSGKTPAKSSQSSETDDNDDEELIDVPKDDNSTADSSNVIRTKAKHKKNKKRKDKSKKRKKKSSSESSDSSDSKHSFPKKKPSLTYPVSIDSLLAQPQVTYTRRVTTREVIEEEPAAPVEETAVPEMPPAEEPDPPSLPPLSLPPPSSPPPSAPPAPAPKVESPKSEVTKECSISPQKKHLYSRKSNNPYSLTNNQPSPVLSTLCHTGFENLENTLKNVNKIIDSMEFSGKIQPKPSHTQGEPHIYSMASKVIIVMEPKSQFTFLGKLRVTPLYGAVEVFGTVLSQKNISKPLEVYSAKGFSPLVIKVRSFDPLDESYDKDVLWNTLMAAGVNRTFRTKLHDIVDEKCQEDWAVLLLENVRNNLMDFLENFCPLKIFPKVDLVMRYPWNDPKQAEAVLQANLQFGSIDKEISIQPQWDKNIVDKILDQWKSKKQLSVVLIGGKSVGKSTTSRYLVNNLLQHSEKVVYIDLDPGQAEFTPPGCVSLNVVEEPLLGPNFTHLRQPFFQLYLEEINVSNCINRYMDYVKKVFDCLKNNLELHQWPVIVNTMGFCRGIGFEIVISTLKMMDPTDVVEISSSNPKNNFDVSFLTPEVVNKHKSLGIFMQNDKFISQKSCQYKFHVIRTMAEGKRALDSWNLEPRNMRELVTYSYLSKIIENAGESSLNGLTSYSISNIIPYKIPFSSVCLSIQRTNVPPTHVLAAMNGNIVALCGVDLPETFGNETFNNEYPLVIQKPPACTCYGFGILRGIDMERKCLFINSPLEQSLLQNVNMLCGCSPLPLSLQNSRQKAGPYLTTRSDLPTSQETRRGTFRMDQTK